MASALNPRSCSYRHRPALAASLTALVVLLAACAATPPPTTLMAAADAALAQAANGGGNESAPAEMQQARDKLERAKRAMAIKDHQAARTLALEAQVDAQLAMAKTLADKSRKAASVVRDDSRAMREELDRQHGK